MNRDKQRNIDIDIDKDIEIEIQRKRCIENRQRNMRERDVQIYRDGYKDIDGNIDRYE